MRFFILFLGLALICATTAESTDESFQDTLVNFLETLKLKGKELIEKNANKAKEALKAALSELLGKVEKGDIKIPGGNKRALDINTDALMKKLSKLYETVKEKINERVEDAKDIFDRTVEKLKAAYENVKNSDQLAEAKAKMEELVSKFKDTLREHELISRALDHKFRREVTNEFHAHLEYRVARSVGDKISNFFKNSFEEVKQHFKDLSETAKEKWDEFLAHMDPYLEKMKNQGKAGLASIKKEVINLLNQTLQQMAGTMKESINGNAVAIKAVEDQINELEKQTQ